MGKLDRTDYLNKSELKQRGWTDVAIERFLPEPERTVSNPYHRTGPPDQTLATQNRRGG